MLYNFSSKKLFEDLKSYYLKSDMPVTSDDKPIQNIAFPGGDKQEQSKNDINFVGFTQSMIPQTDSLDEYELNPINLESLKVSKILQDERHNLPNIKKNESEILEVDFSMKQTNIKVEPNDDLNSGVNLANEAAFPLLTPEYTSEEEVDKFPFQNEVINERYLKQTDPMIVSVINSKMITQKREKMISIINDHNSDNELQLFMNGSLNDYTLSGHIYGALLAISDKTARSAVSDLLIACKDIDLIHEDKVTINNVKGILNEVEEKNIVGKTKTTKIIGLNQNIFDIIWSLEGFHLLNLPGSASFLIKYILLNTPSLDKINYPEPNYDDINVYLSKHPEIWEALMKSKYGDSIIKIDPIYNFTNEVWNDFIIK